MKNLTIFIKSLAIVFILVLMTSCGSKKDDLSSKTFIKEDQGFKSEITIYYEGESINKLIRKQTVPYAVSVYKSKEEAEKAYQSTKDLYSEFKGMSMDYTCDEDKVISTVTYNVHDIDYEKAKEVYPINMEPLISSGGKMTLSEYEKNLKDYVEKKD